MNLKHTKRVFVTGLALLTLFVGGCSKSDDAAEESTTDATTQTSQATETASSEQRASLADWEGKWVSLGALATSDEMKPYAEEAAEEHGETVEEVLAEVEEDRGTDFAGMVIGDDKIAFVDDLDAVEGTSADSGAEYTFKEAKTAQHDGHDFTWYVFEGGEGAKHKYVLLMELHGEESLAHFHMRYGNTVDEALNADDHWYPTFVNPDEGTAEQLAETIFHHHH